MNKETNLSDGIYYIKDGVPVKVDGFLWGYEGFACFGESDVRVETDPSGKKILWAGPGGYGERSNESSVI